MSRSQLTKSQLNAVPGHRHMVDFFGIRLRLVVGIVGSGLGGGSIGAAYLWVLDQATSLLGPGRWAAGTHLVILVTIGVVITALIRTLGEPASVDLVVDNIHIPEKDHEARLRSLIPVSLLCIGAGGTLGPEAPLVTTTGTVANRVGRWGDLHEHDLRIVTLAGMAAGFAVLFGAVLGFACSTAAGRVGLGPIWDLPPVDQLHWIDLGWAVLAGAVGAAIATGFTLASWLFTRLAMLLPADVRPVAGGAALGLIALATPLVLTNGEFQLDDLTTATATALLIASAAKMAGAAIAVATGWRGGFIIPLFFAGFCIGLIIAPHLPQATDWAFVLGVMIAANVGVTKTPLGSTLVVLEMAGMTLLPSALIAALTSLVLTAPVGMIEAQRERVDVYGPSTSHV